MVLTLACGRKMTGLLILGGYSGGILNQSVRYPALGLHTVLTCWLVAAHGVALSCTTDWCGSVLSWTNGRNRHSPVDRVDALLHLDVSVSPSDRAVY